MSKSKYTRKRLSKENQQITTSSAELDENEDSVPIIVKNSSNRMENDSFDKTESALKKERRTWKTQRKNRNELKVNLLL